MGFCLHFLLTSTCLPEQVIHPNGMGKFSHDMETRYVTHCDGLRPSAAYDPEGEIEHSAQEPRHHKHGKEHISQLVLLGVLGHFCHLHEHIIDIVAEKDHCANLHEAARKENLVIPATLSEKVLVSSWPSLGDCTID